MIMRQVGAVDYKRVTLSGSHYQTIEFHQQTMVGLTITPAT